MSAILANINVSEIMSVVAYPISSENTVYQAYGLMKRKHLGGLPVLENGELVGVITQTDVKKIDFNSRQKTKVKDIMSKKPITIGSDEKVSVALEKMTKLRIGRMPVVSAPGSLVGWLSLSDIERAVKIIRNRKLDTPQGKNCPHCNAPLPVTISRTITCQHCGNTVSV